MSDTRSFISMVDVVPEGTIGTARVEHFTVSLEDSEKTKWIALQNRSVHDFVPAGRYCRLVVDHALVMSDTQMERRTNQAFVDRARGDVLVAGLGIGLVLVPLVRSDEVSSITVVEKSQDVIDLVAPHFTTTSPFWVESGEAYKLHKLKIFPGDAFTWSPEAASSPSQFNIIYFDIWPEKNLDHLEEMKALKRRYRKYLVKNATEQHCKSWMGCWSEDELKRYAKQAKLQSMMW